MKIHKPLNKLLFAALALILCLAVYVKTSVSSTDSDAMPKPNRLEESNNGRINSGTSRDTKNRTRVLTPVISEIVQQDDQRVLRVTEILKESESERARLSLTYKKDGKMKHSFLVAPLETNQKDFLKSELNKLEGLGFKNEYDHIVSWSEHLFSSFALDTEEEYAVLISYSEDGTVMYSLSSVDKNGKISAGGQTKRMSDVVDISEKGKKWRFERLMSFDKVTEDDSNQSSDE